MKDFRAATPVIDVEDHFYEGIPMSGRKAIRPYHHPAGGWGALKAVGDVLGSGVPGGGQDVARPAGAPPPRTGTHVSARTR